MPLSNRQLEYLAIAWSCFETEPKIDYEKFREMAGLKTAHSARELMRVCKNKLKAEHGSLSESLQSQNTPKKTYKVTKPNIANETVLKARPAKKAKISHDTTMLKEPKVGEEEEEEEHALGGEVFFDDFE